MRERMWVGAACSLGLHALSAQAQERVEPEGPEEVPVYPEEPGGYGASAYRAQTQPSPNPFSLNPNQKYSLKLDLQLEVPIPLTDHNDSANPGFGLEAMFGWDLGFLLPTVNVGWAWTSLNVPGWDDERSLTRFHFGLGLIAEFENQSLVTPVIGALFDFNWWHVAGDFNVVCNGYYYWGCYQVADYEYTTGFTFKAGADIRFPRDDRFSAGAGVLPSVTFLGGPFRETEWWLSPYVVFTVRN